MPSQPIDAAAELDDNNAEVKAIGSFDYTAPAELFPTRSRKGNRPMGYRRFAKAADAIRFAIEELSPELLMGRTLKSMRRDSTATKFAVYTRMPNTRWCDCRFFRSMNGRTQR